MGRRVTIRDVAADADAAISSVSRVLSGHPHVSEKMKIRVHKAAEKLGYEPNLNAQALRSGVSRTIGFWFVTLITLYLLSSRNHVSESFDAMATR